ncbi:hypothetical protein N7530_005764 [Penicillium desertorum]|uniref:Uncharacterized protein n=1 Tax=Penicillium desertorum TaxID=1303715 RepID=A0A9W9X0P4_9EURO|nr:hypothetical protein N7530_005764 [Penicillium desertorum]
MDDEPVHRITVICMFTLVAIIATLGYAVSSKWAMHSSSDNGRNVSNSEAGRNIAGLAVDRAAVEAAAKADKAIGKWKKRLPPQSPPPPHFRVASMGPTLGDRPVRRHNGHGTHRKQPPGAVCCCAAWVQTPAIGQSHTSLIH